MSEQTIPEFFAGKTIFITGGTGYMGKVLVEKLLYSCSQLDRVYLLLREKKGVKPEDRVEQLYSSILFDRLRKERAGFFQQKVHVIPGDVTLPDLGISDEDRARLVNKVNIIFHVAASVRFDDPMVDAVKMNLRGSREVLELAKQVRDLNVLVHVSTSYSNTNRNPVEEKMYPPHASWRDTIDVAEKLDEHLLRILTPKYLGELPNTYTFTKQLAEHVMYEQKGKMPVVIFRPSIVISSVTEPFPGWIENFNGPVGMLVASGKGLMRSLYTDPEIRADYMPVDVSIRALIAAAWKHGKDKVKPTDDVPIYNCCTGTIKNITMRELIDIGKDLSLQVPLNNTLWVCGGSFTTCKTYHYIKVLLLHLLPALLIDGFLKIAGKKTMLVKLQRRIFIANMALEYYITRQWSFTNKNFIALRSSLLEKDKAHFYYEIENVDIYSYFKDCILGGRRYLLKEPDDTLPQAFAHAKRMYVLDKTVQVIFWTYIIWTFLHSSCFLYLFNCFLDIFTL